MTFYEEEMEAIHGECRVKIAALEARCREQQKAREWEQKYLWSFLRSILLQGQDIALDYRDKGYESMSARVDEAAREREAELDLHRGYQSETKGEQDAQEPAGV